MQLYVCLSANKIWPTFWRGSEVLSNRATFSLLDWRFEPHVMFALSRGDQLCGGLSCSGDSPVAPPRRAFPPSRFPFLQSQDDCVALITCNGKKSPPKEGGSGEMDGQTSRENWQLYCIKGRRNFPFTISSMVLQLSRTFIDYRCRNEYIISTMVHTVCGDLLAQRVQVDGGRRGAGGADAARQLQQLRNLMHLALAGLRPALRQSDGEKTHARAF